MKKLNLLIIVCLTQICLFAQSNNFNTKPWESLSYPIIIDAEQNNRIDFEKLVTDKRVKCIIHRASIRQRLLDVEYKNRNAAATAKNISFVSCHHWGSTDDPIHQADFYLSTIKNNPIQVTALTIVNVGGVNTANISKLLVKVKIFIARIYSKTKHYPLLYLDDYAFGVINRDNDKNSVFANCPLWYAGFSNSLPGLSKNVWDKVTLWQFSSMVNCSETGKCKYNVPGTGSDMGISVFNGTADELKAFFNSYATR